MWHDPDDRLQKAVDRFEEGDLETARTMLRALDRQAVLSPRIDLYLGHCHLEDDRPRAALRRYRRCLALDANEASAWVGVALCHGRLGRLDRAVEALEQAVRIDPDREDVHCHLVHCHALRGDLAAAEQSARRAMRRDPACAHLHRHLAIAYLLAGQPAAALASWRRVLERDPAHPEADVGLGRAYAALGRRAEARRHYLRALEGDHAADAHAGLGELGWAEGRLEDALVHLQSSLLADPGHEEARLRLAEALAEVGRLAEAWATLQPLAAAWSPVAAGSEAPGEGTVHGEVDGEIAEVAARVLRLAGRRAEGLRLLRDLLGRLPASSDLACRLGRHLLEAGRPGAAVKVLRRASRLARAEGQATGLAERLLARALGRRRRRREAVQVLARAAHRSPDDADLPLDVAAALLAAGRPARAERALLHAVHRRPGQPGLWAAAAELALERGDGALAREELASALRLDRRHPQALALLVRWLLDRRQWIRAAHAARAAMRVLPGDHAVVRQYAQALLGAGRCDEAVLPLRRYVLAAPADPEGYRLLGRALEATGEAAAARVQRRLSEIAAAV